MARTSHIVRPTHASHAQWMRRTKENEDNDAAVDDDDNDADDALAATMRVSQCIKTERIHRSHKK